MRESDIQREILQYLALRRIWCRRYHPQPMVVNGRVIVPIRRPDGKPDSGHPDIIAKTKHATINIECKSSSGGKQSAAQIEWQREAEARGETYIVARSLDDVRALFERPPQDAA